MIIFALFYLILTFILGITTLFFLPLNLPRWSKYLIGPALGLIIITELTLIMSLIIGFNTLAIVFTVFIYASSLIWLVGKVSIKSKLSFKINNLIRHSGEDPASRRRLQNLLRPGSGRTDSGRARSSLARMTEKIVALTKQYWPLWLTFLTIGSLVVYVFITKVLTPTDRGLITGGEGLYGDTALHSAYTSSLLYQGLPPKNPLFAGHALIYPFLVDFTSAIIIKLGGSLNFAFSLPQIAYFFGFTTLFYLVARKFTDNRGAFLTLLIFFLGWGLGFTDFLKYVNTSHSWQVTREYTNNSGVFRLHNPLTGLIFPERSFLPGLFIGMLITILIVENVVKVGKVDQKNTTSSTFSTSSTFIIIGLLLGILPLWHTHTFIFFGVSVGVWLLTHPDPLFDKREGIPPLLSKGRLGRVISVYTLATLFSLPVLVWFNSQIGHGSFVSFHIGWMDSGKNFFEFWWKNTGLLIPLSLLGILKLKLTKYKLFFAAPFLLFIIGNIVQFQPWDWDNIKLFTWVFLFLSIPAGHGLSVILGSPAQAGRLQNPFLVRILDALPLARMTISLFFFLSLTLSGTLSLLYFFPMNYTIYDKNDIDLANWIKTHTQASDVFLIDPWPNHPVPGLTGRSVYVGYPGHLWVHGIDYGQRENVAKKILMGDITLLQKIGIPIDYITVEIPNDNLGQSQNELSQVFANQKFRVYKVKTP